MKPAPITPELIAEVAKRCDVEPLQVDEVVGYYSMLHRKPLGKYHVQVCTNISCMLVGGEELYEHAKKKLGIGHKEVTPDGQFSLEEVECMGACSWAPAVEINYDFHHFVTPEQLDQLIDALRKAQLDANQALQRTQPAGNQSRQQALRPGEFGHRSTPIWRTTASRRS